MVFEIVGLLTLGGLGLQQNLRFFQLSFELVLECHVLLSLLGFLLNVVQQAHQNSVGGHQSQCVYDGPVTDAVAVTWKRNVMVPSDTSGKTSIAKKPDTEIFSIFVHDCANRQMAKETTKITI